MSAPLPRSSHRARRAVALAVSVAAVSAALTATAQASPEPTSGDSRRYVQAAWWEDNAEGARLRVVPTPTGRAAAVVAPHVAFRAALDVAGWRDLDAETFWGLDNQYHCHADLFNDKASWNVETYRPAVTYTENLAAYCQPT